MLNYKLCLKKGGITIMLLLKALLPPFVFSSIIISLFYLLPSLESSYSFATYDRNEKLLCASLSSKEAYHLPQSKDINQFYKISSIIYEDKSFYLHLGIDFSSVLRAVYLNLKNKHIKSGASTITMQLARLLCGGKRRSYLQKLKESFYAILLEAKYTKDEIFLLYASNAPFGGNVIGVEAAAFRYFSSSEKELSLSSSAVLAVLPNQPSLVTFSKKREKLKEKRDALLQKLKYYSIIDEESCKLSIAEPLPEKPEALPFFAMHYHTLLKKKVDNAETRNFQKKCVTTLDCALQSLVEQMAEVHSDRLKLNLVHNMAVIVMEVNTKNVLAYVGNTGFFHPNGKNIYVDMCNARRSSGSLLKPFLFAGMLDRGMICPLSLLKDIPTQIQNYSPENNNGQYEGVVKANEALTRSLNVPFVRSLREYGIPPFLELLKKCGFTTFDRTANDYGLPLILGGGEVTLYEICVCYANFMRQAMEGNDDFPISKGAAYLTLNELTSGKRPYDEAIWKLFTSSQKIAWKTGTSDGFKDAWSVGVTPKYVVGVWAGNADGVGRPEIKSNIASLPLMFEIFNVLEKSEWIKKPYEDLKKVKVCSHSHYINGRFCEDIEEVELPINASLPKVCPYCQSVCLSPDGKYRIEPSDIKGSERLENRFILPPFEESFYIRHHKKYQSLPPFLNKMKRNEDFVIVFPNNYDVIEIPLELSEKQGAFIAKASHKNSEAILYWDIDGSYLGKTKRFHQMDMSLKVGRHEITLTDDDGNRKSVVFFIK